jgi:hypothetical protein
VPSPSFFDGATEAVVKPELNPPNPQNGQALTARAPGYLTREQLFTGAPIHLWPANEAYVNALVYDWEFTDGSYRMVRWGGGFTITLDGDLAQNDAVLAKVQEAVAEMERVTGLSITIGPGGACVISLNSNLIPDSNAVGIARVRFRGATIIAGELVFANRGEITGGFGSDYRNTLLHEMGHILGLSHSPSNRDVMTPGTGPGSKVGQFQEGEALALRMMYTYRVAGNLPPDRDPALAARSTATPVRTVFRD